MIVYILRLSAIFNISFSSPPMVGLRSSAERAEYPVNNKNRILDNTVWFMIHHSLFNLLMTPPAHPKDHTRDQ